VTDGLMQLRHGIRHACMLAVSHITLRYSCPRILQYLNVHINDRTQRPSYSQRMSVGGLQVTRKLRGSASSGSSIQLLAG